MMNPQKGFSYLELLLVIALSALLITTIHLTTSDDERLLKEAGKIIALQNELASQSVFSGSPMVMFFESDQYGFEKRTENGWQIMNQKPFISRELPDEIWLTAEGGCINNNTQNSLDKHSNKNSGEKQNDRIRVLLLPDGQRTPFTFDLCDSASIIRINGTLIDAALEILPAA